MRIQLRMRPVGIFCADLFGQRRALGLETNSVSVFSKKLRKLQKLVFDLKVILAGKTNSVSVFSKKLRKLQKLVFDLKVILAGKGPKLLYFNVGKSAQDRTDFI